MHSVLLTIHLIACIALIIAIMLQRSEGGALGMSGGGTGGLISGRGAAGMLVRVTMGLAAVFFVTSISMTYLNNQAAHAPSALDQPATTSNPFGTPSGTTTPGATAPTTTTPDPLGGSTTAPATTPAPASPAPSTAPDPLAPARNTAPATQPTTTPAPATPAPATPAPTTPAPTPENGGSPN
jgi:preprotein translocase subunit SecG